MPIGAPSQTPFRATKGEGEDWQVIQPDNYGRVVCTVRGPNAMNDAHFIAKACNSYEELCESARMNLLILDRSRHLPEVLAAEAALTKAEQS